MPLLTRRTTTGLILASSLLPTAAFARKKNRKGHQPPPIEHPELAELLIELATEELGPGFSGALSVISLQSFRVEGRDSICQFNLELKQSGRRSRYCSAGLDYERDEGKFVFQANVQMDWEPGWRRRPTLGLGDDAKEAFLALVDSTFETFRP